VPKTKYLELKKENSELLKEIENLKYGDSVLFLKLSNEFMLKHFDKSKEYGNLLLNEYPGSRFVIETNELLNNIIKIELEKNLKKEKKESDIKKKLDEYIDERYDVFKEITFYTTKRNTTYSVTESVEANWINEITGEKYYNTHTYNFNIELYVGKHDNGNKYFRLKTTISKKEKKGYTLTQASIGNTSMYRAKLWGDCGIIIDNLSNGDNLVEESLILSINESDEMKFRFHDDVNSSKYHTYSFTKSQRMAFNEMVEKFKRLD